MTDSIISSLPCLSIIVPCYNEQETLEYTNRELHKKLLEIIDKKHVDEKSFILYVNDGSQDKTLEMIKEFSNTSKHIQGIDLGRNFGHQAALLAGMEYSVEKSDCSISIDADLQDDIQTFEKFIEAFKQGHHIVYGVRNNRDSDTFFKKNSAQLFYKLMNRMGMNLIYNHADFRLASKYAMEQVLNFKEQDVFLRGVFPLLKLKSTSVYYKRNPRLAGETKYPLQKMISFALNGLTSFSIFPLRIITFFGFLVSFFCFIYSIYALYRWSIGAILPGWTSTVIAIYFLGGVQLISIGILGEYIGRIFSEVKNRPRYDIKDIFSSQD